MSTNEVTEMRLPKTYTGPGLVDLQVNGYAGVDFNNDPARWSGESLHRVRQTQGARGVAAQPGSNP